MDSEAEAEAINHYLYTETRYMPAAGFFNDSGNAHIRSQAVSIIARHSPTVDPDAFIAYLAMYYFDRYFSFNQFQDVQDVKTDFEKVCLIALSCLSISAQMRIETSFERFPRIKYVNFTHKRMEDMEIDILNALQWRIPVTPFVFLTYYSRLLKTLGRFKRRWINEIIVQAQGENEFVCYKPSQIAMSAFLVAAKIAYPTEYSKHGYKEAEGELSECVKALGDLCYRKNIKIEPPHDELIATLTDEISNKTHLEEGLLEAGTTKGEAKKLAHDEVIAILTDEIGKGWMPRKAEIVREAKKLSHAEIIAILSDEVGNKIDIEQGSLEWKQKVISNEIEEIDEEEEQRLAKGKMVGEASDEEKRRLAKGKMVAEASKEEKRRLANGKMVGEASDEEKRRLAKGKMVAETSEEEKRRLAKGKMVAETSDEEKRILAKGKMVAEASDEEKRRLAKGKMVAESSHEEKRRLAKGKMVAEASDEEKQRLAKGKMVAEASDEEKQRLAKGKMVAMSDIFDEERQRQPPKSISKEEQEKIDRLKATIRLAMEKGELNWAQIGRSLGEIINEPKKPINLKLKWPTHIPI